VCPTFAGSPGFLFGDLAIQQAASQHLESFRLVLVLRFLVLAGHDESGGDVGDPDRRIGRVDGLSSRTGRPEDVDLELVGFDHDVDFLRLRKDGNAGRGCVDAAGALRDRYALHPVHAGLVSQEPVGVGAADHEDDLLHASQGALTRRHHLDVPAPLVRVPPVHAEQIGGEQPCLVPARPGTDLDHGGTIVEGILRHQQAADSGFESFPLGRESVDFSVRQAPQLSVLGGRRHLPGLGEVVEQLKVPTTRLDEGLQLGVLSGKLSKTRQIVQDRRICQTNRQLRVGRHGRLDSGYQRGRISHIGLQESG
jgi:hypothetical protein